MQKQEFTTSFITEDINTKVRINSSQISPYMALRKEPLRIASDKSFDYVQGGVTVDLS